MSSGWDANPVNDPFFVLSANVSCSWSLLQFFANDNSQGVAHLKRCLIFLLLPNSQLSKSTSTHVRSAHCGNIHR